MKTAVCFIDDAAGIRLVPKRDVTDYKYCLWCVEVYGFLIVH